jgi:hypothetical protein
MVPAVGDRCMPHAVQVQERRRSTVGYRQGTIAWTPLYRARGTSRLPLVFLVALGDDDGVGPSGVERPSHP